MLQLSMITTAFTRHRQVERQVASTDLRYFELTLLATFSFLLGGHRLGHKGITINATVNSRSGFFLRLQHGVRYIGEDTQHGQRTRGTLHVIDQIKSHWRAPEQLQPTASLLCKQCN